VGLVLEPGYLVSRHAAEDRLGALRHRLENAEVAEALQEILHEAPRIVARLDHPVHCPEHGGGICGGHGFNDVIQKGRVRVAQQCDCEFVVQPGGAGACHQLVQNRERVPDGPAAGPDDEGEHAGCHGNVFLVAEQL
jgi:hypothetical protein